MYDKFTCKVGGLNELDQEAFLVDTASELWAGRMHATCRGFNECAFLSGRLAGGRHSHRLHLLTILNINTH